MKYNKKVKVSNNSVLSIARSDEETDKDAKLYIFYNL